MLETKHWQDHQVHVDSVIVQGVCGQGKDENIKIMEKSGNNF